VTLPDGSGITKSRFRTSLETILRKRVFEMASNAGGTHPARKGGGPKGIFEMSSTFSVYNELIIRIIVDYELFFYGYSRRS